MPRPARHADALLATPTLALALAALGACAGASPLASSDATADGGAGAASSASAPGRRPGSDRPDADPRPTTPSAPSPPTARDAGPKPPFACTPDTTFPAALAVAEASAAAEVELRPGVRELLVVSDSGHGGAALLIALPSGAQRTITLALDAAANDDLEGIAWRSGALYTLTSSGAVRRFVPDGEGRLVRDQDAYPLGAAPHACADLQAVNCGRNYEGLCLRAPSSAHPCAGYAASKADGNLHCLVVDASGRLAASPTVPPLSLGLPAEQLSDCAFGAAGGPAEDVLAVTTNVFGLSRAYRVHEGTGALTKLPTAPVLNAEATAIDRDGALYVLDDNSTGQSAATKTSCVGW